MLKKIGLGLALLLLLVLASTWVVKTTPATEAQSGVSELAGWLWSSNIGWISLNCANTNSCALSNFAVRKVPPQGALAGYGWSSNVGWVKFNPLGPYPTGPGTSNHAARFVGNNVQGWVRFCGPLVSGCDGSSALYDNVFRGGWDGWVSLSGTTTGGGTYGVTFDPVTKEFSGFAWGDLVVGWSDFSLAACATCTTTGDPTLTVTVDGGGRVEDINDEDFIDCRETGGACSHTYPAGSSTRLRAVPDTGESFLGWEGLEDLSAPCISGTTCNDILMNQDRAVTARFTGGDGDGDGDYTLKVVVEGDGQVTGDVNCSTDGNVCEEDFAAGTNISLNSSPMAVWLSEPSGYCSGVEDNCTFNITEDTTVTIIFDGGAGDDPDDIFDFGECEQNSSGQCLLIIDCERGAGCTDAGAELSNAVEIIPTSLYQTVAVNYLGAMASNYQSRFEFVACPNEDSDVVDCSPLGNYTGSFFLKIKKSADAVLPPLFNSLVRITGTAGELSEEEFASFRFFISGEVEG